MEQEEKKRQAALKALKYLPPGTILGVGTGSTVNCLIDELPAVRQNIEAVVASSQATEERLLALDFSISQLSQTGDVDLYIDGADEANRHFQLIKGGGGALTREKIIAGASRKFICIIDDSKWVSTLGEFPLPVEVIPMAESFVARQIVKSGGLPVLRQNFVTDNGNHILDVRNLDFTNPVKTETQLNQIPGVVTVGIFAHRPADILLIADDAGVKEMKRAQF
jgi:ribose 5-phosphate isomerase A